MITTSPQKTEGFISQVTLSDGTLAGEGGGPTVESSIFWAVYDALKSDDARIHTAGRGHIVFVDERGQRTLNEYLERKAA